MYKKHKGGLAQMTGDSKSFWRTHLLGKSALKVDLAAATYKIWYAFSVDGLQDAGGPSRCAVARSAGRHSICNTNEAPRDPDVLHARPGSERSARSTSRPDPAAPRWTEVAFAGVRGPLHSVFRSSASSYRRFRAAIDIREGDGVDRRCRSFSVILEGPGA